MGAAFPGFPGDVFQFLGELALNNDKEWFAEHKPRYEASVREPALAFIRAMTKPLEKRVSAHLVASDKKVGGSLMRIHRDVRFSAGKQPYKTNVGIQFRHEVGKDVHAPGLYVHIDTERCFVGVGMWKPDREPLLAIRASIRDDPAAWKRASYGKRFVDVYAFGGDTLTRPPRGFDPETPYIEDIKRKDFIATAALPAKVITSPSLVDDVIAKAVAGKPLMKFLCDAIELPF